MRQFRVLVAAVLSTVAMASHAVTATLVAGSVQTMTVSDPKGSGKQVSLSVPSGGATHVEFSNGSGVLGGLPTKSVNGAVALFRVMGATLSGQDGAVINLKSGVLPGGSTKAQWYAANVDANVAALTVDGSAAKLLSVQGTGAFTIQAPAVLDFVDGGAFGLKNVRFDLQNRLVVADVTSTPLGWDSVRNITVPGMPTVTRDVAIWTFDAPVGLADIPVATLATGTQAQIQALGYEVLPNGRGGFDISGKITLPNLRFTNAGFNAFGVALGGYAGSIFESMALAVDGKTYGWGSVLLTTKISTSPAPSSCTP